MAIPAGTPSLLLTLLEDVQTQPYGDPVVQENISAVVNALKPTRRPNLIKDVAQKELYDVLYEIIEKEYTNPAQDQQNLVLNGAIGMALESAIKGASLREATGKPSAGDDMIISLRNELRRKIIDALRPK
jgi:hypothetical protein